MRCTAQSDFMVSRWLRKRTASANLIPAFFLARSAIDLPRTPEPYCVNSLQRQSSI